MDSTLISRPALGSVAAVGDLYDARCERFNGVKIYNPGTLPYISLEDNHTCNIKYSFEDKYSEKFTGFNVNGSLQISVLCGLCELSGSGKYLTDVKSSARSVKATIVFHVNTKVETLDLYDQSVSNQLALQIIESGEATHVVQKVHWGANLIIVCKYENNENKNLREIGGEVKRNILNQVRGNNQGEQYWGPARGHVGADHNSQDITRNLKLDVEIYGDVLPSNEPMPTCLEGALELVNKIRNWFPNLNSGKGKPIMYELYPLNSLRDSLGNIRSITFRNLEGGCLAKVVRLFQEISDERQKINDLYEDVNNFKCVTRRTARDIEDFGNDVDDDVIWLKNEIKPLLVNIRSGQIEFTELDSLLRQFEDNKLAPNKIQEKLLGWKRISQLVEFVRELTTRGVKYIGYGDSLENNFLRDIESTVYVFYFHAEFTTISDPNWGINREIFMKKLIEERENNTIKFYAINDGVFDNSYLLKKPANRSQIVHGPI